MTENGMDATANNAKMLEFRASTLALRAVSMVLLFISIILTVTNKETQSIPVRLPGNTIYLKRSAIFSEIMGVQYYVGAISVVFVYLLLQIIVSFIGVLKSGSIVGSRTRAWIAFAMDQMIAYLLVSAATTVAEIGYIAKHGENKVGWNPVCEDFKHFCTIYSVSLASTFLATIIFIPVVFISAFHLFRLFK